MWTTFYRTEQKNIRYNVGSILKGQGCKDNITCRITRELATSEDELQEPVHRLNKRHKDTILKYPVR